MTDEIETEDAWAEDYYNDNEDYDYYNDIYSTPKKLGLETVGSLDLAEPFYSFDIVLVSRNPETGKFYVNSDSGCSCPSPFEGIRSVADAGAPLDAHAAVKEVRRLYNERYDTSFTDDIESLVSRIMSY